MNWLFLSLVCVLGWGFADLFYKMSADGDDPLSPLKTAVWVGLVMGLTSLLLLPFSESNIADDGFFRSLIAYSPAALGYIVSMIIGYAGLRYLELSIISPIQNASGAMTVLALSLFYLLTGRPDRIRESFGLMEIIGTVLIIAGTVALGVVEKKIDAEAGAGEKHSTKRYVTGALALIFPILYCVFDTIGTAADGIILDSEAGLGLGEFDVLILYGFTFFVAGLICFLVIWYKTGSPYRLFAKSELPKLLAAICEEFGQIFYVFAMASKPMLVAPVVASYCILSVVLSRLFLGEKLEKRQWACVITVIAGIVLLGVAEGIAA